MEIYLEFRITSITEEGTNAGLVQQDKENSIRWKKRPVFDMLLHEIEKAIYDIYLVGVYTDPDTNINLQTLIVEAVYRADPTIKIITQIGGFVPVVDSTGNTIVDIPLHITTEMSELPEMFPLVYGIDNIGPMEGGIRAAEFDYSMVIGDPIYIAEAILEYNVVQNLYEYIPFYCNQDFAETDSGSKMLTTKCGQTT